MVFRGVFLDAVLHAIARVTPSNGAYARCDILARALAADFMSNDATHQCARYGSQYLLVVLDGLRSRDDLVGTHFV
jgi:hypothetical protein